VVTGIGMLCRLPLMGLVTFEISSEQTNQEQDEYEILYIGSGSSAAKLYKAYA
jgi:hypothetical protein